MPIPLSPERSRTGQGPLGQKSPRRQTCRQRPYACPAEIGRYHGVACPYGLRHDKPAPLVVGTGQLLHLPRQPIVARHKGVFGAISDVVRGELTEDEPAAAVDETASKAVEIEASRSFRDDLLPTESGIGGSPKLEVVIGSFTERNLDVRTAAVEDEIVRVPLDPTSLPGATGICAPVVLAVVRRWLVADEEHDVRRRRLNGQGVTNRRRRRVLRPTLPPIAREPHVLDSRPVAGGIADPRYTS